MSKSKYSIFWFRRDLRLHDNRGLYHALSESPNLLPIFIFDTEILKKLKDKEDLRVQFIHQSLQGLKRDLREWGSDLLVFHGKPLEVIKQLHQKLPFSKLYTNHDYEPYARKRDEDVRKYLLEQGLEFQSFKDQCIFEKSDLLTEAKKPYTVFTPYKRKWLATVTPSDLQSYDIKSLRMNFAKRSPEKILELSSLGFKAQDFQYPSSDLSSDTLRKYESQRDFPYLENGTSRLGVHLRFGTVSVRHLVQQVRKLKGGLKADAWLTDTWLSELIWREFFMQILWHYPEVESRSFRSEYEKVPWRENEEDFQKWCEGQTGYPLVDAGMRELNATGHMHNRVRMVAASFLTKHLLIHWLKGERYFARKLLDFDLSANNGNWQWAAGTGCDAAPYFRIFNPESQKEKFDPDEVYIRKWVPEYGTSQYPEPMVEHKQARDRCLKAFEKALKG